MKEYKRLTIRNNGFIDTNCKNCKQCKKVGRKYICNDMTACDEEIIERLSELEDKIENGTLVSIPFIRKHPKVDNAYMVVYESEHGDLLGQMYCGENAKAEAEAKLKELRNEHKSKM